MALGAEHMYLVSGAAAIGDVLVTHQRSFKKGRGLECSKQGLDERLRTSEGDCRTGQLSS